MVNPTVFFDIAVDGEPLGRVSFEVGAGGDEPGGPEASAHLILITALPSLGIVLI